MLDGLYLWRKEQSPEVAVSWLSLVLCLNSEQHPEAQPITTTLVTHSACVLTCGNILPQNQKDSGGSPATDGHLLSQPSLSEMTYPWGT